MLSAISHRTTDLTPRPEPPTLSDATDALGGAAGAANVIMQLAWPGVGWGVRESRVPSGNVYIRPFKRARTTFQYLAVAILGTDEDKAAYRDEVDKVHKRVFSTPESRVKYSAMDPKLQMWVAACLYVGFEDTHEWLYGPMTDSDRESFYRSAPTLGTTLQVRPEQWPATRAEFEEYWQEGKQYVRFDGPVREHLVGIAELRMLPQPTTLLLGRFNRWMTSGFLHREFRDALGLPWSPVDQRRFDRFLAATAAVNKWIPGPLRSGTYHLLLADLRIRRRLGVPAV